jgi:hypothetical protein
MKTREESPRFRSACHYEAGGCTPTNGFATACVSFVAGIVPFPPPCGRLHAAFSVRCHPHKNSILSRGTRFVSDSLFGFTSISRFLPSKGKNTSALYDPTPRPKVRNRGSRRVSSNHAGILDSIGFWLSGKTSLHTHVTHLARHHRSAAPSTSPTVWCTALPLFPVGQDRAVIF